MKTGVTKDGLLVARQVSADFNTGAYSDIGPIVAETAVLPCRGLTGFLTC